VNFIRTTASGEMPLITSIRPLRVLGNYSGLFLRTYASVKKIQDEEQIFYNYVGAFTKNK
jgi:hypothetical protein